MKDLRTDLRDLEDLVVTVANAHNVFDVVCGEVPPVEQQRLDAVDGSGFGV